VQWHIVCEALRTAQKLLRALSALYELCARADGDDRAPVRMVQAASPGRRQRRRNEWHRCEWWQRQLLPPS
jgi:hypothetical protein